MEIQGVFAEFGRLLGERLSLEGVTTEDTIRYTLYMALTSTGRLKHTDLTLEYPHPALTGAKVDTIINAAAGRKSVALEFKYDRANPSGSNQNRTQRAAKVLNDLFRLVKVPAEIAPEKYFVYVTDAEMAGYFRNPDNRLHMLFELAEGVEHAFCPGSFEGFSPTLTKMVGTLASNCVVARVFAAELPKNHCIRIFRVSAPLGRTM
jgi:hypothetical protein